MQKLMQLHAIRAKGKRRFKVTTDSNHDLPIAPDLLDRQFTVTEPDRVWVGDITCIATDEGRLFLAVVIDLFRRQGVGWSLREDMTRDIVVDALRMAWFKRHPSKKAELIFHSDTGSQSGTTRPACTRRRPTSARCGSSKTGLRLRPSRPIRDSAIGYGFQGQGHCFLTRRPLLP